MKKTKIITLRTTEKLKNEIVHLAKLQGVSSGQLIRNWIEVFIKNQVLNSTKHVYQLSDGRRFPNMKAVCNELNISSHTARKRVISGLIKKITIDPNHANKYGNEKVQTARSGETEKDRIQV